MDAIIKFLIECYIDAGEIIFVLVCLRIILGFLEEVQYTEMRL